MRPGTGRLNYGYVAGALALALAVTAGAWLLRRGRERAGFALLVAAPVLAGVAYAGVAHVSAPAGGAAMQSAASPHAGLAPGAADANARSAAVPDVAASADPLDGARRRADELRIARRFDEARAAYAEITRRAPGDADAWADLADASAAAANGDLETGRDALAKALALDPNHLKALWLQASLELQRKRYAEAAALWERLLALVPPDGNDARIVRANLDEARALQRGDR